MRTQISTNVSERTRAQADELMARLNYSLRDVMTIAIDRMYHEEVIDMAFSEQSGSNLFDLFVDKSVSREEIAQMNPATVERQIAELRGSPRITATDRDVARRILEFARSGSE